MPKRSAAPRYLPHVLNAIRRLKESRGSNVRKISNNIRSILTLTSNSRPPPRNLMVQIHRAVRAGLERGVLEESGGRYKLKRQNYRKGTRKTNGQKAVDLCLTCGKRRRRRSCRRRRRRSRSCRRKRRRRRRRRRSQFTTAANSESPDSSSSMSSRTSNSSGDSRNKEEVVRGARRRRRRRRRSRRRRSSRRRRNTRNSTNTDEKNVPSNKNQSDENRDHQNPEQLNDVENVPSFASNTRRRRRTTRNSSRLVLEPFDSEENAPSIGCGNMGCVLCDNMKQEPHEPGPDHNDHDQGYIN